MADGTQQVDISSMGLTDYYNNKEAQKSYAKREKEMNKQKNAWIQQSKADGKRKAKETRQQVIDAAEKAFKEADAKLTQNFWTMTKEERQKAESDMYSAKSKAIADADAAYKSTIDMLNNVTDAGWEKLYAQHIDMTQKAQEKAQEDLQKKESVDVTDKTKSGGSEGTKTDDSEGTKSGDVDNTKSGDVDNTKSGGSEGTKSGGSEGTKSGDTGNTSDDATIKSFYNKAAINSMDVKDPTRFSEHSRRQAEMEDIKAGDDQKASEQHMQIANRDYRVEAEKNAASKAASENAQKVHNMGNASAGAAALERDVASADYDTHMQRSDQQRVEGEKLNDAMWGDRQIAEEKRADADAADYNAKDLANYNWRSTELSLGRPTKEEKEPEPEKPVEEEPKQEEPKQEEPKQEEPKQEEPKQEEPLPAGDPQHIINAILGSSRGKDLREAIASGNIANAKDGELMQWVMKKYNPPITQNGVASYGRDPNAWEGKYLSQHPDMKELMTVLRTGRSPNDASANFSGSEDPKMNHVMQVKKEQMASSNTSV